jgi:hypothetical protein
MHVHLAKVKDTLMKAISDVHDNLKKDTWHIDCDGGPSINSCKALGTSDTVKPTTQLKVCGWLCPCLAT